MPKKIDEYTFNNILKDFNKKYRNKKVNQKKDIMIKYNISLYLLNCIIKYDNFNDYYKSDTNKRTKNILYKNNLDKFINLYNDKNYKKYEIRKIMKLSNNDYVKLLKNNRNKLK